MATQFKPGSARMERVGRDRENPGHLPGLAPRRVRPKGLSLLAQAVPLPDAALLCYRCGISILSIAPGSTPARHRNFDSPETVTALMSGRNAGQPSWLRRFTALLACVSLIGSTLEITLPDVHDGDTSSALGTAANPGAVSIAASPTLPGERPGSPGSPGHSPHVDHCSHTHADGVPAAGPAYSSSSASVGLPDFPERPTSSLPAPPHHPPPIV